MRRLRPIGAALLLAICGCQRKAAVEIPVPPAAPQLTGQASYRFLVEPSPRQGPKDWEYLPPRPIGTLALPEYPAQAMAAGNVSLTLRVVIGTDGLVAGITDSPGANPFGGSFAADFRRAVESAVRSWKFVPAENRWLQDGGDLDGDGKPDFKRVVAREKLSVYYDVRFDFEIVQGKGRVRPSP